MWPAKKSNASMSGPVPPSAERLRQQQQSAEQVQLSQAQGAFNQWLERGLYPNVDACLQARAKGGRFSRWSNGADGYPYVSVCDSSEGVRVASFDAGIPELLRGRYAVAGYKIETRVKTEHPDYDPSTGQSYGMKRLERPMHITIISW